MRGFWDWGNSVPKAPESGEERERGEEEGKRGMGMKKAYRNPFWSKLTGHTGTWYCTTCSTCEMGRNVKKCFRRNYLRAGVFEKFSKKIELKMFFCKYNLIQISPLIRFLQLRNPFGSARPTQHLGWLSRKKRPLLWRQYSKYCYNYMLK